VLANQVAKRNDEVELGFVPRDLSQLKILDYFYCRRFVDTKIRHLDFVIYISFLY